MENDCCGVSASDMARRIQALAHPARLEILRLLARTDACCCRDVVRQINLAQSTTSQHLKVLVEAGLVRYRPDRQTSRYTLDRSAMGELTRAVNEFLASCCTPDRAPSAAFAGGAEN